MKMRRCFGVMLALTILVGSFAVPAMAVDDTQGSLEDAASMERSTGSFSMTISAGKSKKASTSFSLEAGETVIINASYSPRSASVDFGLVGPNNVFLYINVTNGSIDNGAITVTERGTYTLAVRNNSSNQVDVSGFVEC